MFGLLHSDRFIEGIPYAKPPVGDLRYAKPQPLEQSTRTYDATIAGIKCLQLSSGYYQGSEDCLHLDIYVPKFSSSNQRKVSKHSLNTRSQRRNRYNHLTDFPTLHGFAWIL